MATQSTTVQIVMPSVGESITEGTVLEWLKQVGDPVAEGDAVVEISTDKVDGEVFAPTAGVLTKILAETDETVTVGQALGEIEAGEPPADAPAESETTGQNATGDPGREPPDGITTNATPVAARMALCLRSSTSSTMPSMRLSRP